MTLTILSLEDEAEVRQALERDLEEFDGRVRLECQKTPPMRGALSRK